jgi:hypothetical protein
METWQPQDVYMPEPRMPVGRLAEGSRHSPRTTFYPCQSIEGLDTQYCLRQRRHDNRSSEAPHLAKRWVYHPEPSRALQSTGKRCRCVACLPWLPSFHATQHLFSGNIPSRGLQPWSARWMRSPPARLAVRLKRFQACALRNGPALQVPPESNEQATGQGHDPNAPHALASQSKAGIEPDAEGRVGLIA